MLVKVLFFTGLLISGQALAVDEDFYLPYTDTYGYVYDPETGQYVKQDIQPSAEVEGQKPGNNAPASIEPQIRVDPAVTEPVNTSKGSLTIYTAVISGAIVVLIALGYWSFQRKKTR